jgi:hypothetical protein
MVDQLVALQFPVSLNGLTARGLSTQEKSLWIRPFPAQFETAKVLVPRAIGNIRLRAFPSFEARKIIRRQTPLNAAQVKVMPDSARQVVPFELGHNLVVVEDQLVECITDLLLGRRILCCPEFF